MAHAGNGGPNVSETLDGSTWGWFRRAVPIDSRNGGAERGFSPRFRDCVRKGREGIRPCGNTLGESRDIHRRLSFPAGSRDVHQRLTFSSCQMRRPEDGRDTVLGKDFQKKMATIGILIRSKTTSIQEDTEITELCSPKGSTQTDPFGRYLSFDSLRSA
ncbi:hypothetical protein Tco_1228579 [Tanacetum coccineum]